MEGLGGVLDAQSGAEEEAGWECPLMSQDRPSPGTRELLELERCVPPVGRKVGKALSLVTTPLRIAQWQEALVGHPDQEFAAYVIRGLREGFRVGYKYGSQALTPASRNMQSARQNKEVVEGYLGKEVAEGRVVGPLTSSSVAGVQVSPFGVIPKPHQPGKWRLIVDLSAPEGHSVNDGIDKKLCALKYVSVDDVALVIQKLGRGAQLAKMDVQAAYRNVPVHPDDRLLLGMKWEGQLFVDTALPFGLRSAPKIFTAVADALQWVVRARGVRYIAHYLDDFIVVGAPGSDEGAKALDLLLDTCRELGVPVAGHKVEGPSTRITFLGIEIDTVAMELRLPQDKLQRLTALVSDWRSRKSCRRQELESLIGHLSHACKVVRPGRRFLRGMIELLAIVRKRHHHVRLNTAFRADLEWWHAFLTPWNGVSMLGGVNGSAPGVGVWSDASGSWGCGAVWEDRWLQVSWEQCPIFGEASIAAKELLPIVLAAVVWGKEWAGLVVECHCDNEAVVRVLHAGSAKDRHMVHFLRCLFFVQAKYQFSIVGTHIPGRQNPTADALSRNQMQVFFNLLPQAQPLPVSVSQSVLRELTNLQDWTSDTWTTWWSIISSAH